MIEGAGNAGCLQHPQPRAQKVGSTRVSHHRYPGTPGIPCAMVLTAYSVLSPATNSSCHRRQRIEGFAAPGRACQNLRQLDTSNGCQDHTALPYASGVVRLARRKSLTRFNPPYDRIARPTLPRPPHPVPTFVTMANAPHGDRTATVLEMICPTAKAKYFFKRGWTRPSPRSQVICPPGKISGCDRVEHVCQAAKAGIT
jgi:hypothetical protein